MQTGSGKTLVGQRALDENRRVFGCGQGCSPSVLISFFLISKAACSSAIFSCRCVVFHSLEWSQLQTVWLLVTQPVHFRYSLSYLRSNTYHETHLWSWLLSKIPFITNFVKLSQRDEVYQGKASSCDDVAFLFFFTLADMDFYCYPHRIPPNRRLSHSCSGLGKPKREHFVFGSLKQKQVQWQTLVR